MRRRLLEVIEVIFLCIGYILTGAYAAIGLQVDSIKWLFFILHLISGIILLEATLETITRFSLLRAPSLVFVLVSSLYYLEGSIKYFAGLEFYPQFSITVQERFYGSIAIFCALLLCLVLIRGLSSRLNIVIDKQCIAQVAHNLSRVVVLGLVGEVALKASLVGLGYGPSYLIGIARYMMLPYSGLVVLALDSVVSDIVLILSAMIIVTRRRNPVAFMGIGLHLFWAIFMKSRFRLLVTVLSIGICLSLNKGPCMVRRFWRWTTFLVFVLGTVGGVVILGLLGRPYLNTSSPLYTSVAELGYRLDLSDFSVAYMKYRSTAAPNFGIIAEGIMNMIPRALWPTKTFVGQYERLFINMGWPAMDYPDTFFSSGVLVGGWLGFFLVPLGFIIYVEVGWRMAVSFMKRFGGNIASVAIYLYLLIELCRTEMDWNLFFLYYFRAPLIGIILLYVSCWLVRLRIKGATYHIPQSREHSRWLA